MKWFEDKEYQEMCEGAEKIQALRKIKLEHGKELPYKNGDCFLTDQEIEIIGTTIYNPTWYEQDKALIDIGEVGYDEGGGYKTKKLVWLPSQEDLQEIYCKYFGCAWIDMESRFYECLFKSGFGIWNLHVKALLVFVMHELYRKKWNPETKKWEKTEE